MFALFRNYLFQSFLIFWVGLFVFTLGLAHQEIIGFESRFYLFALEMWRHGVSWFPTTYGVPYPDYPVTTTLFIYGLAKLFGHLDKFIAVLPSATAAAVTLSFTYLIGVFHSVRWGLFAVFFLFLTNTFVIEARTISPDQFVVMVTVLSFYLVYSETRFGKKQQLLFLPFVFLFGFACRGPIGLVIPAGVICIYYLLEKNWRRFFVAGFSAIGLLLLGCLVLLGAAYHVGGEAFVRDVWRMEVSGRMQDSLLPWYFYFIESLGAYALTYPLAIVVFLGCAFQAERLTQRDKNFLLKLLGWVLVILIGLSIPAGKKIRYILAMSPALALTCAALFGRVQQQGFFVLVRQAVVIICLMLPLLCGVSLSWLIFKIYPDIFNIVPLYIVLVLLAVLQIIMFAMKRRDEFIIAGAALTFIVLIVGVIEPVNMSLKKGKEFVASVEAYRLKKNAKLVFYRENPDGTPIKYIVNTAEEVQPVFLDTPDALNQFKDKAVFISDPEHFSEIPTVLKSRFKIIKKGSVGHDELLVFDDSL